MPTGITSEWTDCQKSLPYKDYLGHWRIPLNTQYRITVQDGRRYVEYREREETFEEWCDRQI